MPKSSFHVIVLYFFMKQVFMQSVGSGTDGNLRVCIVEGKGLYRKAGKFCPILDEENSGIECVLGTDRLDCLRRMGKGTVDFGVFSPEDLIAAQWAHLDVLVTNELRHRPRDFERNVVAVINKRLIKNINPESIAPWPIEAMLRNTTLCHPGLGGDDSRGLSDTLSQYLESLVTERSCDATLTLAENRIRSMAEFFGAACKAGPWVPDPKTDAELKLRYPSLCSACGTRRCDVNDPYWGMSGALTCLVDGAGDVTWVSLLQAQSYFQYIPGASRHFVFLCRNGTTQPIDSTDPCVWLQRPWSSVVAKRKSAEAVSELAWSLTNSSVTVDKHWRGALAALLEINQAITNPLTSQKAPLDYLSKAIGFREAYSQTGCFIPRHITLCTSSVIEHHKCDWLSEAGSVYGVDPPLQCVQRESIEKCLEAVENGDADVTVGFSNWLVRAARDYALSPLLYEMTPIIEKLNTIGAYTNAHFGVTKIEHLRGKKVFIPSFDGVAWHTIVRTLIKEKLIPNCKIQHVADFFGESCVRGIEGKNISKAIVEKLTKSCRNDGASSTNDVESEAIESIILDSTEVIFISMRKFRMYTEKPAAGIELVPICPEDNQKYCLFGWSSLGQVYASKNITSMKKHEVVYMFKKLDQLFGRYYPFRAAMFSMYSSFNHQNNVLFHNNTNSLLTLEEFKTNPYRRIPLNFESSISNFDLDNCYGSNGNVATPVVCMILLSLVLYFVM